MTKKKGKQRSNFLRYFGNFLLFIIKIPYYLVRGALKLIKIIFGKIEEKKIKIRKDSMVAKHEPLKVIHTKEGSYESWLKKFYESDSQIGIILGARGSGKTAFGMKFLENFHTKNKKKCFAMGFNESELPSWIKNAKGISELENDSFVLIDEGGILFNSRSSMSNSNKLLSQLILIARHKNISILFISQNSSNLEVNILRQADFLILKPSSLLQKEFERKIIQNIYKDTKEDFEKFNENKGVTYIYSGLFRGFVSNPLPSFWKENLGKSFK